MKKKLLMGTFLLGCCLPSSPLWAQREAFPNYAQLTDSMGNRVIAYCQKHRCLNINGVRKEVLKNLRPDNQVLGVRNLPPLRKKKLTGSQLYDQCKQSTLVVGMMTYYPQLKGYQADVLATAVALTEDGICATNFHVFADVLLSGALDTYVPNDFMRFVMDYEGRVYPLESILAIDPINDWAVFKVHTEENKLTPMPLGNTAREGDEVYCLSHPKGDLYHLSKGIVAKNHSIVNKDNGQTTYEMQITADYAVGSSGGPLIDQRGNLIGIVGSTVSLYPNPQSTANFQMALKKSVPVMLIKECFQSCKK